MKPINIISKLIFILALIVSQDAQAICKPGKLRITTICVQNNILLKDTGAPAGATFIWQKAPIATNVFTNIDTFRYRDSIKINVNTGLNFKYRCIVKCNLIDSAFTDTFVFTSTSRVIKIDQVKCSPAAGILDSLVLRLHTTSTPISKWDLYFQWGRIYNNSLDTLVLANTNSDSIVIPNSLTPASYIAKWSICPIPNNIFFTVLNANGISIVQPTGLTSNKLVLSKDCANDSLKISFANLDSLMAKKYNITWYKTPNGSSASLIPGKTDTILKDKPTSDIVYYKANVKLCTTSFDPNDSLFTDSIAFYPILGNLSTRLVCPGDSVYIDYANRLLNKSSVYTYWKTSTGYNSTPNQLLTDPADSAEYTISLTNHNFLKYCVYSKFCSSSTKILDSTNVLSINFSINTGNTIANIYSCNNDSVNIVLNSYSDTSTFPLVYKWEYLPPFNVATMIDSPSWLSYTQAPQSFYSTTFRLRNGYTKYRKSSMLCDDIYSTRYPSSIVTTLLPSRTLIANFSCTDSMTLSVKDNDTIVIQDTFNTYKKGGLFTYQWLRSTDKVNFSAIVGATNSTYRIPPQSNFYYYKRIVRQCPSSPVEDTSSISAVLVPTPNRLNGETRAVTDICLNNYVLLSVFNAIAMPGETPTYQWQYSTDGINFYNIESSNANDATITEYVTDKFRYFRRLTAWCPSGIVDSTTAATLVSIQPIPWCESFDYILVPGNNIVYNCWNYYSPACPSLPSYGTFPIWSGGSGRTGIDMQHQNPTPPPANQKADGKLVTPAYKLLKGHTYRFSFFHKEDAANLCWDSLYVTWGTSLNACAISNRIGTSLTKFNFDQWTRFWADFTPLDTNFYYFAINYRDNDATKGNIIFDDACVKEVRSCAGRKVKKGQTRAPSKINQRVTDPGNYDKDKVTHQYCIGDTIELTYDNPNYDDTQTDTFDYFGMTYQFYKKRLDLDWGVTDTFFKSVFADNNCHITNRTDYHAMNVLVTDTNTWYKIVATCSLDGAIFDSDSLLVNGTHSIPYCEDWEGVNGGNKIAGNQMPDSKFIAGNSAQIIGAVPSFSNCATCWASYPQSNPPAKSTPDLTFHTIQFQSNNSNPPPTVFFEPDGGYLGDKAVVNCDERTPVLTKKVLVFPAVRLYPRKGYRVSFRYTDNRTNAGNPYGNASQDLDSLYLTVSKGVPSGKTIDSFTKSKMIGKLLFKSKSNLLETGTAKYLTFWTDYQPTEVGTYYFGIVAVAGPGNGSTYRFTMDYFCIDELPAEVDLKDTTKDYDCSKVPEFIAPLQIKIAPDGKMYPWTFRGKNWCLGNEITLQLDFAQGPNNNWQYGWNMMWEKNTDQNLPDSSWVKYGDSSNVIRYVLGKKYQNYRLRLSNYCKYDTIIGPFNVTAPGGLLPWREGFDSSISIPSCWDVYSTTRVNVSSLFNKHMRYFSKSPNNYLVHDFLPSPPASYLSSLTHVPPAFSLAPGTYRFSFWYRDLGIQQPFDSLRVGWQYARTGSTFPAANKLINKLKGDYLRNTKEYKWRYYTSELQAMVDTAYNIYVNDFNIGNKKVYRRYFDDYCMKPKYDNDVLVIAIDSPDNQCALKVNSTVKISVMNIGVNSQSNIPLKISVNNGPAVSAVVPNLLGSNEVATILVPGVDLSKIGDLSVAAWTELSTDQDKVDDTFKTFIVHKELYPKPVDTGDTFCKNAKLTYVVNTPNTSANWYETPWAPFPVMVGDTLRMNNFLRDTVFYVSAVNGYTDYTSPTNYSSGTPSYSSVTNGLFFDNRTMDTLTLRSFVVYASKVGSGTVRFRQYGTILKSYIVYFTKVGKQTIYLDTNGMKIPPGMDYEMEYVANATAVNLAYIPSLFIGYGIPDYIEINNPINATNPAPLSIGGKTYLNYMYFYNLEFRLVACESERVPVKLYVKDPPSVNLKDTARVCSDPVYSTCGPTPTAPDIYTYNWNNPMNASNTSMCQDVKQSGWYKITVTNQKACSTIDSTFIYVDPSPVLNLQNDSFCNKSTLIVDSKLDTLYNAIVWSNGTSGQKTYIKNPGTIICTAYNLANFCSTSDTITLKRIELPVVNAGNDRVFCDSPAYLGVLLNPALSYIWQNNLGQTVTMPVYNSGKYSVIGTDPSTHCSNSDTIVATLINKPIAKIGRDTVVCSTNIPISGPTGNYYYLWNTTSTNKTIIVSLPGTYKLTVTDANYGCLSVDSIKVSFKQVPIYNLGNDTSLCANSIVLNPPSTMLTGYSYLWNGPKIKNATSKSITADTSGFYSLVVNNGCYSFKDSIKVNLKKTPNAAIDLLPDTAIGCNEVSVTATSNITGVSIQWSPTVPNGKNNTVLIKKTGSYSVSLTNECGAASKAVLVMIDSTPKASFVKSYPSSMSVALTNTSTNGRNYLWNFGDGNTNTDFHTNHTYSKEGFYVVSLKVTNSCGQSSYSDTLSKRVKNNSNVSIATLLQESDLILYPNPTTDKSTLMGNNIPNGNYNLTIRNLLGQSIQEAALKVVEQKINIEIDLSKYANGEYLIEVTSDKESIVKKLELIK